MKRIFGIVMVIFLLSATSLTVTSGCSTNVKCPISQIIEIEKQLEFIATHNVDVEVVQIYDLSALSDETLVSRVDANTLIIERCIGRVVDDELNGRILNYENPDRYYISYRCVPNAKKGDLILSYMVYNPYNNCVDDIINRYDFIIDMSEWESGYEI